MKAVIITVCVCALIFTACNNKPSSTDNARPGVPYGADIETEAVVDWLKKHRGRGC